MLRAILAGLLAVSAEGRLLAGARPDSDRPTVSAVDQTDTIRLDYRGEPVDEPLLAFIEESTGKIVMPVKPLSMKNRKVTLTIDEPVTREQAINLLFRSMRLTGIGVIEKEDVIIIGLIDEIMNLGVFPIVAADQRVENRQDKGSNIVKLFQLQNVRADDMFVLIANVIPPAGAHVSVESSSNTIMLAGDVDYCQHVERLIDQLDQPASAVLRMYHLHHANAVQVATLLEATFGARHEPARTQGRNPSPRTTVPGLAKLHRVQPMPGANKVLVIANAQAIELVDQLLADIDQPRDFCPPFVIRLKHADAEQLARELNQLLVPGSAVRGAPDDSEPPTTDGRPTRQRDAAALGHPPNRLTGHVVPIKRQNALAIICPSTLQETMRELVTELDRAE